MADKRDCADLWILCTNVCDAPKRGTDSKELDDLSEPVRDAVDRLGG